MNSRRRLDDSRRTDFPERSPDIPGSWQLLSSLGPIHGAYPLHNRKFRCASSCHRCNKHHPFHAAIDGGVLVADHRMPLLCKVAPATTFRQPDENRSHRSVRRDKAGDSRGEAADHGVFDKLGRDIRLARAVLFGRESVMFDSMPQHSLSLERVIPACVPGTPAGHETTRKILVFRNSFWNLPCGSNFLLNLINSGSFS